MRPPSPSEYTNFFVESDFGSADASKFTHLTVGYRSAFAELYALDGEYLEIFDSTQAGLGEKIREGYRSSHDFKFVGETIGPAHM